MSRPLARAMGAPVAESSSAPPGNVDGAVLLRGIRFGREVFDPRRDRHVAPGVPESALQQRETRTPEAHESGTAARDELSTALPGLLPRLWRFALRLAGDQHDAEDLLQRACMRALERQHQLQPGTSALSWMFSIIHSVWLNEVRSRKVRNHASMQWTDELVDTIPDPRLSPEANAFHRQVIAAVAQLPEAQRAVMLLVAVEGLSYRDAADALGIPIGTVMSRLARARLTIGQAFGAGTL